MARILVVDDDRDLPELVADLLRCEGHTAEVAHDGRAALERLHEELPDVVLLDVEMPRLTGPETAYRMFVHDAGMEEVPIVLLSGVADLSAVAREVGTPYFLVKPYEVSDLLVMLERALVERVAPVPAIVGGRQAGG